MKTFLTCMGIVALDIISSPLGCDDDRMQKEQPANEATIEAADAEQANETMLHVETVKVK